MEACEGTEGGWFERARPRQVPLTSRGTFHYLTWRTFCVLLLMDVSENVEFCKFPHCGTRQTRHGVPAGYEIN